MQQWRWGSRTATQGLIGPTGVAGMIGGDGEEERRMAAVACDGKRGGVGATGARARDDGDRRGRSGLYEGIRTNTMNRTASRYRRT